MSASAASAPSSNGPVFRITDVRSLLQPRRGSRLRTWAGVVASVMAHISVFGGAWLYARLLPPRTVPDRPIMAKLVQLGSPHKKTLKRNTIAAGPQTSHSAAPKPIEAPMVLTVPRPVPSDSDKATLAEKDNEDRQDSKDEQRAEEAIERQKKLQEALAKLETPADGPAQKVNEREGHKDGVAEGDSDTAADGDRYMALVKDALKKNFTIPTTISQQERLFLSCDLMIFIAADGKIVRSSIDKSSGNPEYDRAVEATLLRTTLPPPPASLQKSYEQDGLAVRFKP